MRFLFSSCAVVLVCAGCSKPETVDAESPAGYEAEWIVFSSSRTGNGDIYALHPESSEIVRITFSDSSEGTARFDAFRRRIVHHRYEENPARAVLVSEGRDLFEDPNGDVAPVWSPGGDRIVYARREGNRENLYVADSVGANEMRLTNTPSIDRYPSWSPDGRSIVFARRLESGWDLFQRDVSTGLETRLTDLEGYIGHPSWSPDGRYIAFDTMYDGQTDIAVLDVAAGAVQRITDRPGNDLIPTWSKDSRRIVFGGEQLDEANWDLWLADVETRAVRRLTTDPAFDGGPVFVPESSLFGFK